MDNISSTKADLRRQIRREKLIYNDKELQDLSMQLIKKLEQSNSFKSSKTILCYWSLPDEVFTHDFIKKWSSNKIILLPVVVEKELIIKRYSEKMKVGAYNIKEPEGEEFFINKIDLGIIPGIAFDLNGRRLGRGAGYYDKYLSKHVVKHTIGLCFPFQILKKIPCNSLDIKMDEIII